MKNVKFNSLNELYNDFSFDEMLNVDLVIKVCNLKNDEFVKFFELIYKETGFYTCDGFYVDKETVGRVMGKIKNI